MDFALVIRWASRLHSGTSCFQDFFTDNTSPLDYQVSGALVRITIFFSIIHVANNIKTLLSHKKKVHQVQNITQETQFLEWNTVSLMASVELDLLILVNWRLLFCIWSSDLPECAIAWVQPWKITLVLLLPKAVSIRGVERFCWRFADIFVKLRYPLWNILNQWH